MNIASVKRIEFSEDRLVFIANDGGGDCFEVSKNLTDIAGDESVEDFVIRHNGVAATIGYLHAIGG